MILVSCIFTHSAGLSTITLAVTADFRAETETLLVRVHLRIFNSCYINELIIIIIKKQKNVDWYDFAGKCITEQVIF